MRIEFDFRTDITVCELIQYLSDELEVQAHFTDNDMARCVEDGRNEMHTWRIEEDIKRESKLMDLIDDIVPLFLFSEKKKRHKKKSAGTTQGMTAKSHSSFCAVKKRLSALFA